MKKDSDDASLRGLTDSHFHSLAMLDKGLDPLSIVQECKAAGMLEMVDIGLHPVDLENRRSLLGGIEGVYFTSGLSPANAANHDWKNQLRLLEKQVDEGKIAAIGELGLDWYRNYGSRESQIALLSHQLEIAQAGGLPVIIHNRQADSEIIDLLKKANLAAAGVMHCFSSDYQMAAKCMDLGYAISFAGNVTYKNAGLLRDVATRIPLHSLLLETDAPYLSPQTVRASVNTPKNIIHTYKLVAEIRGITVKELADAVRRNFRRLFKIEPVSNHPV